MKQQADTYILELDIINETGRILAENPARTVARSINAQDNILEHAAETKQFLDEHMDVLRKVLS